MPVGDIIPIVAGIWVVILTVTLRRPFLVVPGVFFVI
jgi:hypothetical protein